MESRRVPESLAAALADRYELLRELGAGGMATVYLARDVKHERDVAVKVLKPELGAVLGLERFQSEIRVTANLQHPNLLPLFDSGEAAGMLFYVMPFVEGETLRARLEREQQLPVDEAVRIATAIANALAYAHQRGVIHRDLKPENILLQAGQPVVADFGIALAVSNAGGARVTQTGLSLGTPQYMSPEQATGDRVIDARSDLYSLAAMTYEMLTAEPPHTGPNAQAIMAKLLTAEAPLVSATRRTVPPYVDAAVAKGLAKLPADRFANALEFSGALSGTAPVLAPPAAMTGRAVPVRRWRERIAWSAAIVATGIAGMFARRPSFESVAIRRFVVETPDSTVASGSVAVGTNSVAVSDDSRQFAFVGRSHGQSRLYLRRADELEAHEVPGVESPSSPSFSPDGRFLAYLGAGDRLQLIPVTGGIPRVLVDSVGTYTWGEDGAVFVGRARGGIWRVSTDGKPLVLVSPPDSNALFGTFSLLPGATRAIVSVRKSVGDAPALALLDLSSRTITDLHLDGASPRWIPPGILLFRSADGVLSAVRSAPNDKAITGTPVIVADNVARPSPYRVDYDVSRDGTLFYRRQEGAELLPTSVALVDREGRERTLRANGQRYDEPVVSADGRHVVVRVGAKTFNDGDLWLLELASGAFTPLTRGGNSYRPRWSRDGKQIFYITGGPLSAAVRAKPWDGSGVESVLVQAPDIADFAEGAPGGWSVLRTYGSRDILIVPRDSLGIAKPRPFVTGPANETNPAISPSGRLLAYQSDETGTPEIYVRALPDPGPRVSVSVGGGRAPQWSADGTRILYRGVSSIESATIVESPALTVTRRATILAKGVPDDQDRNFALMPDGGLLTTFGAVGRAEALSTLVVLTGWQALLDGKPSEKR